MKTKTAPVRWRKCKTALAILAAIISTPFVIIALFATVSGGRR